MNVLIITYTRHLYLREILDVLMSQNTNIFIYQNKIKNNADISNHNNVKSIISDAQSKKDIQFFEPNSHLSSADSIKYAITEFFDKVESGVIIEDDCIPRANLERLIDFVSEIDDKNSVYSLYDPNTNTQTAEPAAIVRSPFLHVWGWYSSRKIWSEFILSGDKLNIDSVKIHLKNSGLSRKNRIYWELILKLVKSRKIISWDYDFWIYLIDKKKNIYCMLGNQIDNRGTDEFATFSSKKDCRIDRTSQCELRDLREVTPGDPNEVCALHYQITYYRIFVLFWVWVCSRV